MELFSPLYHCPNPQEGETVIIGGLRKEKGRHQKYKDYEESGFQFHRNAALHGGREGAGGTSEKSRPGTKLPLSSLAFSLSLPSALGPSHTVLVGQRQNQNQAVVFSLE